MSRFIDNLLRCLPQVRKSFYASGFQLPCHYLAAVEAARQRNGDELDYERYLDEVLREYAALPYPWQSSVRHLLKPGERSAYLDMLAARSAGDSSASLDPNFNLFVTNEAWLDLLGSLRAQKQKELEQHSAALGEVGDGSSAALIDGILRIAAGYGCHPKRLIKTRDESIDLEVQGHQSVRTSLRVVDLPALNKRGSVIVQYFFSDLTGKPFGLDTFVPGGHLYSEWNKSPQAVLFSFYVQCRFAVDLDSALSEAGT